MNAAELFEHTREALSLVTLPAWNVPGEGAKSDVLTYLADEEDGPLWALADADAEDGDFSPVDPRMARSLIVNHLRSWLLERGWQVQVRVTQGKQDWRLVDCLATLDGGGDRLDADYPGGSDELDVLCASVVTVARYSVM